MRIVVLSFAGREEQTARALAGLNRQNPGVPYLVWRTDDRDGIGDFHRIVQLAAASGESLLFLEDDIVTARNFFRYASRWPRECVTSFFHTPRVRTLGVPVPAHGFQMSQALKVPAHVARAIAVGGRRLLAGSGAGQDDELAACLCNLQERVIYHRSLVQHVGAVSVAWGPGRSLEHRTADDFPGEDFDCLL